MVCPEGIVYSRGRAVKQNFTYAIKKLNYIPVANQKALVS